MSSMVFSSWNRPSAFFFRLLKGKQRSHFDSDKLAQEEMMYSLYIFEKREGRNLLYSWELRLFFTIFAVKVRILQFQLQAYKSYLSLIISQQSPKERLKHFLRKQIV